MNIRIVSLLLLVLCLAVAPSMAQANLYDNGPVNGQVDAWTINFGFAVTDSIQVTGTIGGLDFYAWLLPGDTISNVEVSFGSTSFGNDLFDGTVNLTQSNCSSNQFGYNVCLESGTFSGPTFNGNAWLTLQNANVPSGDPVYWDENSGVNCESPGCPSLAQQSSLGTIPSEAFTIVSESETSSSTTTGTTPEPSNILLFGSGILGLAGVLRRKLF